MLRIFRETIDLTSEFEELQVKTSELSSKVHSQDNEACFGSHPKIDNCTMVDGKEIVNRNVKGMKRSKQKKTIGTFTPSDTQEKCYESSFRTLLSACADSDIAAAIHYLQQIVSHEDMNYDDAVNFGLKSTNQSFFPPTTSPRTALVKDSEICDLYPIVHTHRSMRICGVKEKGDPLYVTREQRNMIDVFRSDCNSLRGSLSRHIGRRPATYDILDSFVKAHWLRVISKSSWSKYPRAYAGEVFDTVLKGHTTLDFPSPSLINNKSPPLLAVDLSYLGRLENGDGTTRFKMKPHYVYHQLVIKSIDESKRGYKFALVLPLVFMLMSLENYWVQNAVFKDCVTWEILENATFNDATLVDSARKMLPSKYSMRRRYYSSPPLKADNCYVVGKKLSECLLFRRSDDETMSPYLPFKWRRDRLPSFSGLVRTIHVWQYSFLLELISTGLQQSIDNQHNFDYYSLMLEVGEHSLPYGTAVSGKFFGRVTDVIRSIVGVPVTCLNSDNIGFSIVDSFKISRGLYSDNSGLSCGLTLRQLPSLGRSLMPLKEDDQSAYVHIPIYKFLSTDQNEYISSVNSLDLPDPHHFIKRFLYDLPSLYSNNRSCIQCLNSMKNAVGYNFGGRSYGFAPYPKEGIDDPELTVPEIQGVTDAIADNMADTLVNKILERTKDSKYMTGAFIRKMNTAKSAGAKGTGFMLGSNDSRFSKLHHGKYAQSREGYSRPTTITGKMNSKVSEFASAGSSTFSIDNLTIKDARDPLTAGVRDVAGDKEARSICMVQLAAQYGAVYINAAINDMCADKEFATKFRPPTCTYITTEKSSTDIGRVPWMIREVSRSLIGEAVLMGSDFRAQDRHSGYTIHKFIAAITRRLPELNAFIVHFPNRDDSHIIEVLPSSIKLEGAERVTCPFGDYLIRCIQTSCQSMYVLTNPTSSVKLEGSIDEYSGHVLTGFSYPSVNPQTISLSCNEEGYMPHESCAGAFNSSGVAFTSKCNDFTSTCTITSACNHIHAGEFSTYTGTSSPVMIYGNHHESTSVIAAVCGDDVLMSVPFGIATNVFNTIPESASSMKQFLRVAELGPPNYLQLWMLGITSVSRRIPNDGERLTTCDYTNFMGLLSDLGKYCLRRCGGLSLYFSLLPACLSVAKLSDHGYDFKCFKYPGILIFENGYLPTCRSGKTSRDLLFVLRNHRSSISYDFEWDDFQVLDHPYPVIPTPVPVEVPSVGRYLFNDQPPGDERDGFSLFKRERKIQGNVFSTSASTENVEKPMLGQDVRRNTHRFLDPDKRDRCLGVNLPSTAMNLAKFSYINSYTKVLEYSILNELRSRARTHYAEDLSKAVLSTKKPAMIALKRFKLNYTHAYNIRVVSRPFISNGLRSGIEYVISIFDLNNVIVVSYNFHQGITLAANEYVDICCALFGITSSPNDLDVFLSSPRGDLSDRQLIDIIHHLSAEGVSVNDISSFLGFDVESEMCGRYLSMSDPLIRDVVYDSDTLRENWGFNDSSVMANLDFSGEMSSLLYESPVVDSSAKHMQYFYNAMRIYACDFLCSTVSLMIATEYVSGRRSSYSDVIDILIPCFKISSSLD